MMKKQILILFIIIWLPSTLCFNDIVFSNTTKLEHILSYSFDGFSCVQLYTWVDELPREYYEVLHKIEIPVITNKTQKYCYGFALYTKNTKQLKTMLFSLRKYYQDRIVCYIYDEDPEIIDMIENGSYLFGESEALIGNDHFTYKLDPVERKFYEFNITEEEESWGQYQEILDFKGRTVTIASFNISMFSTIGPIDDKRKPAWVKGLDFHKFLMLASLMNVTWRVTVPTDENKWGLKMANGSWSGGIFKALIERKADVGIGCVWLTVEKYQSFPLSVARDVVELRHLVRRPRPLDSDWSSIFRPFPLPLWGLLLIAAVLNTLTLALLSHLRNKIHGVFKYEEWATIWGSGYITVSVMLLTGNPSTDEKQGSLRHLLNGWTITCFLLATCFGSSLVSHLTTPDLRCSPETIKELVEGEYFWGMGYKPDMNLVLDLSNPWHKMWSERFVLVKSKEEHIRLLDDDKYVLWGKSLENVGFYLNEDYLPLEKLTEWEASNEVITNFYFTYALTPGSQLLPSIDKFATLIAETGHTARLLQMMFYTEGEPYMKEVLIKTKESTVGAATLTLSNFQGLFYILVVGLAIATISFWFEIIVHKKAIPKPNCFI